MKINTISAILLLFAFISHAQTYKGDFEISGSLGTISDFYMITGIDQGLGSGYEEPITQITGNTIGFFTARYYIGQRIAVGVAAGAEAITGSANDNNSYSASYTPYTYHTHYYTLAAEFTFIYTKKKMVQLYSTYGFGGVSCHTSGSYPYGASFPLEAYNNATSGMAYNVYISPFGLRIGHDLAGFIDFGIGYKGLISGGISYRIKTQNSSMK